MGSHVESCILLSWLLASLVFCQVPGSNPCTTYITLTDPTMDVSYTTRTTTGTFLNETTWYRYTNSGESILASSCPTRNACGTPEQVWMNGSAPSYADGPVMVDTCYKDATGCCASKGQVRARNCKTFLVYMLNPLYGGNRWCFDKVLRALPPVLNIPATAAISTSPPVGATNTAISTSPPVGATKTAISTPPPVGATKTAISTSLPDATTEAGLSPEMIAAIGGGGGGLGLLLLIIILIAVVRHKLKARTVEPTPPKPSQNGQHQECHY